MKPYEYIPPPAEALLAPAVLRTRQESRDVDLLSLVFCIAIAGLVILTSKTAHGQLLALFPAALPFLPPLFQYWEERANQRQIQFLKTYTFPSLIEERVKERYPHLSGAQLSLVTLGLRQFFLLSKTSGEPLSMPSRVVDAAWHEFILLTRGYANFCREGMGRFLHHTPNESIYSIYNSGGRNIWQLACDWEGINARSPSQLPFLFQIDTLLNIPDGITHSSDAYEAEMNFQCLTGYFS
ncbi:MAG: hypothetical protein K0S36_1964 [Nitrosospira multiformis]|jgi:hypothetical protein|nr:hypothetical protein [Nitrosospira multiformis]